MDQKRIEEYLYMNAGNAAGELINRLSHMAKSDVIAQQNNLLTQAMHNLGIVISETDKAFKNTTVRSDLGQHTFDVAKIPTAEHFAAVIALLDSYPPKSYFLKSVGDLMAVVKHDASLMYVLMYYFHLIEGSVFVFAKHACGALNLPVRDLAYFQATRPQHSLCDVILNACLDEICVRNIDMEVMENRISSLIRRADDVIRESLMFRDFSDARNTADLPPLSMFEQTSVMAA